MRFTVLGFKVFYYISHTVLLCSTWVFEGTLAERTEAAAVFRLLRQER